MNTNRTKPAPVVERVLEGRGTSGTIVATATVRYADGARLNVTFTGSYRVGAPVLVGPPGSRQMEVSDPSRYGNFAANPTQWIRAFYAPIHAKPQAGSNAELDAEAYDTH